MVVVTSGDIHCITKRPTNDATILFCVRDMGEEW
jgi:hypothetical protein